MPRVVVNAAAIAQRQAEARLRKQREAAAAAAAHHSSDDGLSDSLEAQRPPPVNTGYSPPVGGRRKCEGKVFTPILEPGNKDGDGSDGDPPTDRSSVQGVLCAPFVFTGWILGKIIDVLNSMPVQTVFYFAFVAIFQLLTESLRAKEEYHFDKHIADTLLENHFDSSHNTFQTIRRVSDFYDWGNNVLIPGLFANAGPCAAAVGATAAFASATDRSIPTDLAEVMRQKGCNDDAWPDASGYSSDLYPPTAYSVPEIAEAFDMFDWSEGIVFKQVRVSKMPASACHSSIYSGACLPEVAGDSAGTLALEVAADAILEANAQAPDGIRALKRQVPTDPRVGSRTFGYNWTHPTSPLAHPWNYFSAEQLGATDGVASAAVPSFRTFPGGGFVAVVIPFLSATLLPEERGNASQVTDFRDHAIVRRSDSVVDDPKRPVPKYFCVRLSWNGEHIHQICDPNDPNTNRTTGIVRAAVEAFFNDLKRGHWIDKQTRMVTVTLPLRSNYLAVRSRVTLMLETGASGAVLPSYDIETRVESTAKMGSTKSYVDMALILCLFFVMLELIEMCKDGPLSYFTDPWNLMDWGNYAIFGLTWLRLHQSFTLADSWAAGGLCDSVLCQTVGYRDDWMLMETLRSAKLYLSLCVCIQLLKLIKFMKVLIPKMALATAVLYKGVMDLIFFGIVFMITMGAFSMMFYVQLGPNMEGYNDKITSFVSLARALFGDFDVPDILNNSRGYLNIALFILYLFVAVFIMLSMFLAILGESQAAVRTDQDEQRANGTAPPDYGIFEQGADMAKEYYSKIKRKLFPPKARTKPMSASRKYKSPGGTLHTPCADMTMPQGVEEGAPVANLFASRESTRTDRGGNDGGGGEGKDLISRLTPRGGPFAATAPLNVDGSGNGGTLTARGGHPLAMRTEIRELASQVNQIADRQKRMSSHLKHLDPKSLSMQLQRLANAIDGIHERKPSVSAPSAGCGDRPVDKAFTKASHEVDKFGRAIGEALQDVRSVSIGSMKEAPGGGPRRLSMPPLLDVCLGEAPILGGSYESENMGHNNGEAPGGSGWDRARRHLAGGRLRSIMGEEGDTPAKPRREKPPSMRRKINQVGTTTGGTDRDAQRRHERLAAAGLVDQRI